MNQKAFAFNSAATYRPGGIYTAVPEAASGAIHNIVVTKDGGLFQGRFPNILGKYRLPYVSSDTVVQAWNSHPMQFWQNQVNFATWCATGGCGVSSKDHLSSTDPLMKALYCFHVYYVVRRIYYVSWLSFKYRSDRAWDAFNNPYDRRAYNRICDEFGISAHTDWRRRGINQGLGRASNYWTHNGYHPVDRGDYDQARMSFTKQTTMLHVDYIAQDDADAYKAWATFVLDHSTGLTHPGVEPLNDSIRTYVWAILGAQAQTRTRILGTGTAFDAQKQFLANVEDAIASPVDLPAAIKRYQDVLQYAGSKVDYVFGIGLYMAPSDMLLRIGQIHGYNNEIVTATSDQKLGFNSGLNAAECS